MPSRFADLRLNRLAVHEVFVRGEDHTPIPPRCSSQLVELEREGVDTIRDRLVRALESNARSVEMAIENRGQESAFSTFHGLIGCEDCDFILQSRQVAEALTRAQMSRAIPGGIVLVMGGTLGLDRRPFAGVIKAEMHSGFRREESDQGPLIRYLSDLLLTPSQKFHKIGIFVELTPPGDLDVHDADRFTAFVFDAQMRSAEIDTAATYFYEGFLGCRVASTAPKLTKDFYLLTRKFIDTSELGEEEKVETATALNVYLRSNRQSILPLEFAEQHLPPGVIQQYDDFLRDAEFPETAIQKDLSLIKSRLRVRKIKFSTDVRISAPADRFSELVTIESATDGQTTVRVKGNIIRQD